MPPPGSVHILWLEHVSKRYGRRLVLDDVDLLLPTGSFNLVVGPNGSGKTTLLRLFSTYARASGGRVHWGRSDGTETTDPDDARRHIGYAGHTPLLYDELTTEEHLRFLLQVHGRTRNVDPAVEHWIDAFHLAARRNERAESLSRGLRQRAALAQAFVADPTFLILDEPQSNLDAIGVEDLLAALRERRRAATIVLATHDPDVFRPLADRTLEVGERDVKTWGEKL